MGVDSLEVLFFGDQTGLSLEFLITSLRRAKALPLSTAFAEKAAITLKYEITKLPLYDRERLPKFATLAELAETISHNSTLHPALESALILISQFVHFFGFFEETHRPYPRSGRIAGLCIGSISAAAVTASRSLSQLLPLAVEAVGLAFRVGLEAFVASQRLSQHEGLHESWSWVFHGIEHEPAKSALEDFIRETSLPQPLRPYISAVGPKFLTISGAPYVLRQLQQASKVFTNSTKVPLKVHAPYHADHIHDHGSVKRLGQAFATSISDPSQSVTDDSRIYYDSVGRKHSSGSWPTLSRRAVEEALTTTLRWDLMIQALTSDIRVSDASIMSFGPSKVSGSLISAMETVVQGKVFSHDAVSWSSLPKHTQANTSDGCTSTKIAIVGLSGRFPGGANPEAFWRVLETGLDMCKEIPKDRFDIRTHVDPHGKVRNTSHTPYGCFIDDPGLFDPLFFNMSPREAAQTCPMQRLALVTAHEALEMAGFVPNRTPSSMLERVGTFYGQTSDDYREMNAAQAIDTYFITGGIRAFGPGRINYHFKFKGPSYNIDTACSSSLAAVQVACTSLLRRECDTAVSGGLSVLTSPDFYAGLSRGQFLSKTGSCKTFDDAADGYCRGDSVGTVVLKRYDDAIADNDNILGTILGSATNHSADAISITHPHAGIQENLYRKVLAESGVDPLQIEAAEMHGTGTQAGDGMEMQSISNVLAPEGKRSRDNPLFVGSVKANIGHGEAASGISALIKSIMMFQKSIIPPHVGIKGVINRKFPDLDKHSIRIAKSKTSFPQRNNRAHRHLLLNNFSAAGGNTALVLEDYVRGDRPMQDERSSHPVAVSAKSTVSLRANVEKLLAYIQESPQARLSDLSYTTTARRSHYDLRFAVSGSSCAQIAERLQLQLEETSSRAASKIPKVAFAFTGQGSLSPGLGKDLYQTSNHFREQLHYLNKIATASGLPPFIGILDGSLDRDPSPTEQQLLHTAIQLSLTSLWSSWGIQPDAVIGHSIGEYAALSAAGVLTPSDAIVLVGRRAQLLERECRAGTHSMLAIKLHSNSVEELQRKSHLNLETACINSPNETVLSGETHEIARAEQATNERGYRSTRLNVPYAFHSTQVDPIIDEFKTSSQFVNFQEPVIPIISSYLGRTATSHDPFDADYLAKHMRGTVSFGPAMTDAVESGLVDDDTAWIEIGPHPVCLGMIKQISQPHVSVASLRRREAAWDTVASSVVELYNHGAAIDWTQYHKDFSSTHTLLALPTYSFDNKNYWLTYNNDWSLDKGQLGNSVEKAPSTPFSTTTLQRIVTEDLDSEKPTVVFESDFAEPGLHEAVRGHLVNGTGLCPSSVYADMAMTAADFVRKQIWPDTDDFGINIRSMEVVKPVIVSNHHNHQLLHVTATVNVTGKTVCVEFASVDDSRQSETKNAQCLVEFGSPEDWSRQWSKSEYLIESRINFLEQESRTGSVQRVLRGMAYKLFAALVDYSDLYQGMQEVLLESQQKEAAARIEFQAEERHGKFHLSPYWIDSLAHLSGFVLNANETLDSRSSVYISHGWDAMRFVGQFSAQKSYRTYVKMQPVADSTVMAGDVYVFDDGKVVGLIEGLKFQRIPRTVLNHLLPKVDSTNASRATISSALVAEPSTVKKSQSNQYSSRKIKVQKPTVVIPQPVSYVDRVRAIVANEIGISVDELQPESSFSRLGVDSLLSLTIIGRLREELNLPVAASAFLEHDTFGSFIVELEGRVPEPNSGILKVAADVLNAGSNPPTADSSDSDSSSVTDLTEPIDESNTADTVKAIIAEEMGFDIRDVPSSTRLGSLGMDSLMSLTVAGVVREKLDLDISHLILADDISFDELDKKLAPAPMNETIIDKRSRLENDPPRNQIEPGIAAAEHPPASSVLLQGNPKSCEKTMFLLPDGSGLATTYAALPSLMPNLAVYGLNSPFLKNPRDYNCGIDGIAKSFVAEIRKRQSRGPYLLGGWSVGGVIAYEAASILINEGELVDQLLLIDAPCPTELPPLPTSLVRFFDSIGLFGDSKAPEWLLEHFDSTVENLAHYKPAPLPAAKAPKSITIWAREGVCGDPTAPRPGQTEQENRSQRWILDNRTDFSPNGWQKLLGKDKTRGVGVQGNHFTMFREPNIASLASQIRHALS